MPRLPPVTSAVRRSRERIRANLRGPARVVKAGPSIRISSRPMGAPRFRAPPFSEHQLAFVLVVPATAERDVLDAHRSPSGVGLEMVELQERAFGAPVAIRGDVCALFLIAS